MFSSRLPWDLRRTASHSRSKPVAAPARPSSTSPNPTHAGRLLLPGRADSGSALRVRSLFYEPQPAGSAEARAAVAGYYRARGHQVEPERIIVTASTSESYAFLFKLLADPGDEVLVPRPSYPLFEFLAALESFAPCHTRSCTTGHGLWISMHSSAA